MLVTRAMHAVLLRAGRLDYQDNAVLGMKSCLDASRGLCCMPGRLACAGLSCCGREQSCIGVGVFKGTCCLDEKICGMFCCDNPAVPHSKCWNAGAGTQILACCSPEATCGSNCCWQGIGAEFCADARSGLCCRE